MTRANAVNHDPSSAEVMTNKVRVPPFIPDDPDLWFAMVEQSFELANVTRETTKFKHVVTALDPKYAREVKDVILQPHQTTPYTDLRSKLSERLSSSQEAKTRRLLETEEIGDRKPSAFLRHLKDLAGSKVDETVVRQLWLGRLPTSMQQILATQKDAALDKVGTLADAIFDTKSSPTAQAAEVSAGSATENLVQKLAHLTVGLQEELRTMRHEISALRESRSRGFDGTSRSRSRSSSRSRTREENIPADTCWYHYEFGARARKCKGPPCKFSENFRAEK